MINNYLGDAMKSLIMTWDTGEMRIELTSFFPCTISNFRKLLGVADKAKNSAEIRLTIKDYCTCMHNYYYKEHADSILFCQVLEGNVEALWDCLAADDIFDCERQLLLKDVKEQRKRLRTGKANLNSYACNVKRFKRYLDILN